MHWTSVYSWQNYLICDHAFLSGKAYLRHISHTSNVIFKGFLATLISSPLNDIFQWEGKKRKINHSMVEVSYNVIKAEVLQRQISLTS